MKLKALALNCTLKKSPEVSNTGALIGEVVKIFEKNEVKTEVITLADYTIGHGIT
ncbi:8-demethyl-8-aminoriboflavin-5'-phosphate (AFP) synthase RosB, partial [Priestia megaterium]